MTGTIFHRIMQFSPEHVERVDLDMDLVARRALGLLSWHLEYDCHGAPATWRGEAKNEAAADNQARQDLAAKIPTFNAAEATLTVCLEA